MARMALLLAGLPVEVGGLTVNRLCGSRAPGRELRGSRDRRRGRRRVHRRRRGVDDAGAVRDGEAGRRVGSRPARAGGHDARLAVREPGPGRDALPVLDGRDRRERRRALGRRPGAAGRVRPRLPAEGGRRDRAGRFDGQIVPITVPAKKGDPVVVTRDEHPRADTSAEALARLRPAFREGGSVTAGNSSGINDGASAVLLVEAERARALGLRPMARIVSTAVAGVDPAIMGYGPVPATRKALERAGIGVDDLDLVELNEAFASQSIVCIDELGLDPDEGQRQRRRDRPRSPARDERRAADHDAQPRAVPDRRPLGPGDDVHRRRAGDRDDHRAHRRVAVPRPSQLASAISARTLVETGCRAYDWATRRARSVR